MAGSELEFENQAFVELLSEDGLIILARGLGLDRLFLKFLKLYSDPHNLVLVLNTSSAQEKYFLECLSGDVECLPKSITNEYSVKDREQLYLRGGVLFITSRILVVDLLRKYCPVDKVAGVLVYNAHRVTESSTEAFILTLYRQANKSGFIKAFSDAPEPLVSKFSQLERLMRSLFLKNLYLWPRFHATVSASLSRHKPDVVELRQPMSTSMTAIQMAVLDIMKACVSELKKYNPCLDTDEVTVESSMGKAFDQIIKVQLDPIWNQLGSKSKQLIFDLRMLRTLLYYLTQYDSVTFYSYLETVRSSDEKRAFSSDSTWAFMDSSNILFAKAKERVYGAHHVVESKKAAMSSYEDSSSSKSLLLKESPKWHLLAMVLEEIQKESKSAGADIGKILVITNDDRTCYQLRQYLCEGGRKLLEMQYQRLIASKLQGHAEVKSKSAHRGKPRNISSKKRTATERRGKGATKKGQEAKKRKADQEGEELKGNEAERMFSEELKQAEALLFEEEDASDGDMVKGENQDKPELLQPSDTQRCSHRLLLESTATLHALSSSENPYHLTRILWDLRPKYVVLYDAAIDCVRQIEVFKASNPGMPLRVYFLLYDSSVEEQKYLTSLRREKESFHALIRERAHMVVPVDQEGKVGECSLLHTDLSSQASSTSTSTRKAGGRKVNRGPQQVLVDVREFRSALPFMLHKRGIRITPLTLEVQVKGEFILSVLADCIPTDGWLLVGARRIGFCNNELSVGDYILSPEICVERKSISDLIGSLNSGRLFNQVTAMTRHYKKPVLLIEFDENQPFSLQTKSSFYGEISSQNLSSKLVLLTLHFPRLRIVWCCNPHATAELFEELKLDQPEPDAEIAIGIGQDTLGSVQDAVYSAAAQDFLLKLPGINSKNYRCVMDKVTNLQDLISLSETSLQNILGNSTNASLLWGFLHRKLGSETKEKLKSR